jgi:protein TonB
MTEAPEPRAARHRWSETLRWTVCFALALAFHAGGAAALLARWTETSDLVANAPVIMLDLAPAPVAPEITPTEVPPDVVQSAEAEPEPEPVPEKPVEKVEVKPEPVPEPELAMVPPPPKPIEKPKEVKKKQKHRAVARATSTAENRADHAAAPMPGASSRDSNALPNWKSQLVARLERYKRYPSEARSRGEGGVAQLAFSIDRNGGVHHARILRSSGSSLLDRETLSLVERAQPLPPPPPEMGGAQIAIVVPIRYNIR